MILCVISVDLLQVDEVILMFTIYTLFGREIEILSSTENHSTCPSLPRSRSLSLWFSSFAYVLPVCLFACLFACVNAQIKSTTTCLRSRL